MLIFGFKRLCYVQFIDKIPNDHEWIYLSCVWVVCCLVVASYRIVFDIDEITDVSI